MIIYNFVSVKKNSLDLTHLFTRELYQNEDFVLFNTCFGHDHDHC